MIKIEFIFKEKVPSNWKAFLKGLSAKTFRTLKLKGDLAVTLVFVKPAEIRKLNYIYRGLDQVTDVLAFEELDEILICLGQAKKQLKKHGLSLKEEAGLLFVHGLLHLFGYDHEKMADWERMDKLQKAILGYNYRI